MGEEEDIYTKDGTLDYQGNPADKTKTGTWKACPFILGTCFAYLLIYENGKNPGNGFKF